MRAFASDNYSGVHPDIMDAIVEANKDHMISYGEDPVSDEAEKLFQNHFGEDAKIFFMTTGTATNTLILKHLTRSWNSVICTECAHITVDECGSSEAIAGVKLIHAQTVNGKLNVESLKPLLSGRLDVHQSQPAVVSITQSTELGTLYTLAEIKDICDYAHSKGLYVHMDGARITNAATALGVSFKEMTVDCGVDVLSFGGTKIGCMGAEAAVFINSELGKGFGFVRKQGMQLTSKMRFIGAQFKALLSNELWKKNAEWSNSLAAKLAAKAAEINGVEITRPVEANGVFAIIPKDIVATMQEKFPFYIWDEATGEVRWMTSWSTTEEDIDNFCAALKDALD
ncbi:threonine aldolase family protein [Maridesulfovibrio hydrothermalis]|uniref:Low specificity L-threonine aldolase n=1 Tax=Maridesulfovibrio hydrothermalis AM13 = DSM 14728 TaxID=1121451 RepID=L0RI98_9BACT|nr:aminotransferase class V-fold PLP-dependent enzyme [Maridesulfovibrio hydrothermalis]CCO25341.1 Low specificity L-threonine aldolase [Maridesulfovibrio hydrothermalis AM13 = DSM 14728]